MQRLYLETMEEMLKGVNKMIIDGKPGANGVVPYLPLPELRARARRAGASGRRAAPAPRQLDSVQGARPMNRAVLAGVAAAVVVHRLLLL